MLIFQIQIYLEKTYNLEVKNIGSQDELLDKFYASLGKNALIIIDNVEKDDFIKSFLPKNVFAKFIITSRYKNWKFPLIDLSPFSQNDAFKYIKNSLNDSEKAF